MQCVNFVFFGLDSDFIWRFCQDGLEISGFKVSDQTNGGSNAKAAFKILFLGQLGLIVCKIANAGTYLLFLERIGFFFTFWNVIGMYLVKSKF